MVNGNYRKICISQTRTRRCMLPVACVKTRIKLNEVKVIRSKKEAGGGAGHPGVDRNLFLLIT